MKFFASYTFSLLHSLLEVLTSFWRRTKTHPDEKPALFHAIPALLLVKGRRFPGEGTFQNRYF
jgi:hypothetical protein